MILARMLDIDRDGYIILHVQGKTTFDVSEIQVPNLFVIVPLDKSWKNRLLGDDVFGLHLVCGCPGHFHMSREEPYKIKRPKQFLVKVAPYAASLLNWFRQFPLFGWTIPKESCEFIREMGADAVQYYPDLKDDMEYKVGHTLDVSGAALRELQAFLHDDKDPKRKARRYQGLSRVVLATGEIAWMCDEHAASHKLQINPKEAL